MLGPPLVLIEEDGLKTISENNARMQELGLKSLAAQVASPTVFTPKKSKNEDSASEYDPEAALAKETCHANHCPVRAMSQRLVPYLVVDHPFTLEGVAYLSLC